MDNHKLILSTPVADGSVNYKKFPAPKTKKERRKKIFLQLWESGVTDRESYLNALLPEGGVPVEAAKKAWLGKELNQAATDLRGDGFIAFSMDGEVVFASTESNLDERQRRLLKKRRDRSEQLENAHRKAKERIDKVLGEQLSLFDAEDESVCL